MESVVLEVTSGAVRRIRISRALTRWWRDRAQRIIER
jgi:hypothetical protein